MTQYQQFESLMGRYIDGQASPTDAAQLSDLLRTDPAARARFMALLNVDAALAESAAGWRYIQLESKPAACTRNYSRWTSLTRWGISLAACLMLVFGMSWFWRQGDNRTLATVVTGIGVEELTAGKAIGSKYHELKAGVSEILTVRGARVVIEAPAGFQFESAQRLRVLYGRVSADVPPAAKGFTVITPTGQAVDLGTKFGVDVTRDGRSEVHVFQGEVVAQSSNGSDRQTLRDGEAYAMQMQTAETREIRSGAFIRPDEVGSLHAAMLAGQRQRAEQAGASLRADPALIAWLDFEASDLPEGIYRIVQGRWPGSRAPEFVNVGDHMKLDLDEDRAWPQLTLAAWVRLDRLGGPYQSLLHTNGWNDQSKRGQVHWMVNRYNTMRLALYRNTLAPDSDESDGYPDSRTSVLPEQGRWVHLVTVYDADARTVRFFLNGQFDKQTQQEIAYPARLGPAQIGNWNVKDRILSGRIDDLLLLGRAMSDSEIHDLWASGNPYR